MRLTSAQNPHALKILQTLIIEQWVQLQNVKQTMNHIVLIYATPADCTMIVQNKMMQTLGMHIKPLAL